MNPHREYRRELALYCLGLALAIILTVIPTLLVRRGGLSAGWTLTCVLLFALAQIIVHFRCFLHIGLGRSHRDPLYLVLFSSLIVFLMVGGTLALFFDQMGRM
ncbi:MAG: cytochrome-c oxidase [Pseudomonas sp.]|nr:cytochrome-c oxidase [Pseudomonas sp.]